MQFENWNGWMVLSGLELPPDGGIKAELLMNGRWEPACLFPNLSEEILFEPNNNQDWNWATEYRGLVPAVLLRNDRVYWNYCVNFAGVPKPADSICGLPGLRQADVSFPFPNMNFSRTRAAPSF